MKRVLYIILIPKMVFDKTMNDLACPFCFWCVAMCLIRDKTCTEFVFSGEINPSSSWTHWRGKVTVQGAQRPGSWPQQSYEIFVRLLSGYFLHLWCSIPIHKIKVIKWPVRHLSCLWFCEYYDKYKVKQGNRKCILTC